MRSFLLITFIAAAFIANAGNELRLTAATVSQSIQRQGADKTLWKIYDDKNQWDEVLGGIATGRVAWLTVANQLHAASDAGASSQLGIAVGEALEHRPANVLRVAGPVFGVAVVCGGPDIDDPRYDSYESSIKAIEKRKRRVRAVTDGSLRKVRDRCLATLEESKAGIARFYGR